MYLQYGNYRHASGEAEALIQRSGLFNDAGFVYGFRETWQIRGRIIADTQAALTQAINNLKAAYSLQAKSVGLFLDDGSATAHTLPGLTAVGGVRVTSGPNFQNNQGAEYVTYRSYDITLEATYHFGFPPNTLISWNETLEFSGGGPRFVFLQPLTGLPQRQQVAQATPYRATQSGGAVGISSYPIPGAPLWPEAEHIDQRRISFKTPKRQNVGQGAIYIEFECTWEYFFESAVPVTANPTLWAG